MIELSTLDVEKLIHLFVQNLTFQVSSNCNKKLDRVNFISFIDVTYYTNLELLRVEEKSKDIAMNSTLNIADVQSVCHFIETRTKFLDKFAYPNDIPSLTYHFDYINKKIVQKINETDKNMKKCEAKYYKNKLSQLKKQTLERATVENNQQICDKNVIKNQKKETLLSEQGHKDLLFVKRTNTCLKESNFTGNIFEHIRQKAILNEEYLQLYVNNVEFMKNVNIILYVASKTLYGVRYHPDTFHNERLSDYQDILMLCEHVILCLINPSKKVFVEVNLSITIQKHLLQGYTCHFNCEIDTEDYSALLILNKWAKSLIRHSNTTILRTISFILKCNVYDILILSQCSDNNFL